MHTAQRPWLPKGWVHRCTLLPLAAVLLLYKGLPPQPSCLLHTSELSLPLLERCCDWCLGPLPDYKLYKSITAICWLFTPVLSTASSGKRTHEGLTGLCGAESQPMAYSVLAPSRPGNLRRPRRCCDKSCGPVMQLHSFLHRPLDGNACLPQVHGWAPLQVLHGDADADTEVLFPVSGVGSYVATGECFCPLFSSKIFCSKDQMGIFSYLYI